MPYIIKQYFRVDNLKVIKFKLYLKAIRLNNKKWLD